MNIILVKSFLIYKAIDKGFFFFRYSKWKKHKNLSDSSVTGNWQIVPLETNYCYP